MNKFIHLGLLAIVVLFGQLRAPLAAQPEQTKVAHLEGGYSIEIPMTLKVVQDRGMPDFVLYRVADRAGKQLLLIYLGNFPKNQLESPHNAISSSTLIGGYAATSIKWLNRGTTSSGSTLIHLKGSYPAFAQMIFQALSKGDSEIVERVVRSFRKDQTVESK